MKTFGFKAGVGAMALSCAAVFSSAATVAEWQFNGGSDLPGGSDIAMDAARAGASSSSSLFANSTYTAGATNVGAGWSTTLSSGYASFANQGDGGPGQGLQTKDTDPTVSPFVLNNAEFRDYIPSNEGGLGSGVTFATVVRRDTIPNWNGDIWGMYRHFILSGANYGHPDGEFNVGTITTNTSNQPTTLAIFAGKSGAVSASVTTNFEADKWYFVAGSVGHDQNAVLYVREMNVNGPASSLAAVTDTGVASPSDAEMTSPEQQHLLVGARWSFANPADGWGGEIAYVSLQDVYTSDANDYAAFDAMFESMAVPEPTSLAVVAIGSMVLLGRRSRRHA